jgi:hypothetical protein
MEQDPEPGTSAEARENTESFYARGERAWQDYVRTGVASSAEDVFARLDALTAAHRARMLRTQLGNAS